MPSFIALSSANGAFVAYAITVLVLCLNMMLLWLASAGPRGKAKVVPNAEDARSIAKDATVSATDPPEVARILRAHRNAVDNIVPFLFLGLVYVMLGAPVLAAQILFGVFAATRILHSIFYLAAKQPFRTLVYVLSVLDMAALMVEIVRALLR